MTQLSRYLMLLSSDGQWVYYLDDMQGNEIGHYVRKPIAGGDPQDLTPERNAPLSLIRNVLG